MSDKNVNALFEEAQQKMNGYAMLLHFHLANLCIKADPMALLSATVKIDGEEYKIEDVASVSLPNEKQFAVTPKEPDYVFPVGKAIKFEHPEFEMEEKTERNSFTDEEETVLYYTMPTVNEDRRDVCMDYIKIRKETITAKIDAVLATSTANIAKKMVGLSVENLDNIRMELQEIYDWHIKLCNEFCEDKTKEVEDAYQEYLKDMAEKTKKTEEKAAAQGQDTVFSMNMNDE